MCVCVCVCVFVCVLGLVIASYSPQNLLFLRTLLSQSAQKLHHPVVALAESLTTQLTSLLAGLSGGVGARAGRPAAGGGGGAAAAGGAA